MAMEKNNSEELNGKQARIPLTDDEMEKVSGGQFDPGGGQGGYDSDDFTGGYNSGPCSERGYYMVSNACLNPLCSKLRDNGVVCSCQDGPQRGITPSPCPY